MEVEEVLKLIEEEIVGWREDGACPQSAKETAVGALVLLKVSVRKHAAKVSSRSAAPKQEPSDEDITEGSRWVARQMELTVTTAIDGNPYVQTSLGLRTRGELLKSWVPLAPAPTAGIPSSEESAPATSQPKGEH